MERLDPKSALYDSKYESTSTDTVFFPLFEFSDGAVSLKGIWDPNIRLNRMETLVPGPGAAAGRSRGSRGIKRYGFAIRPISCIVKICWAK